VNAAPRVGCLSIDAAPIVIASDSEAIQTKPQPQSSSLDRVALLAMTIKMLRLERIIPRRDRASAWEIGSDVILATAGDAYPYGSGRLALISMLEIAV
jgi:hypothetical protein